MLQSNKESHPLHPQFLSLLQTEMEGTAVNPSTVMGPEGMEFRTGSMPPSWDGVNKPFRLHKEEILNWKDFTTLKAERQAPAVIIRLTGEPQRLALTVSREERVKPDGLDKVLKVFEDVYSSTEEQDLYYFYKQLTKFRRKDAKSPQEFLSGFTARAEKLKGCEDVKIPPKLLALMMIDFAELTDEQENNLFGACGGDLGLVKVSRAIKLVLKESTNNQSDESSKPAYVSDQAKKDNRHRDKKFCRYCKKKGHIIEDCWKLQKKNEKENKSSSSGSGSKNWKFPVFASNNKFLANPIIDSAAGTSLIGEETLKEYCKILKINNLETASSIEKSHCFGYYGEEIQTKCSVFIPLPKEQSECAD